MEKSRSLTQDAYERLRADVIGGRVKPGQRLKIVDLCTAMGVSLSAVREALARLTADGLVTCEPQRGYRAAPIAIDDFRHLQDARIEIESLCIERSIKVGEIPWETGIVAALHGLNRTSAIAPPCGRPVSADWAAAHTAFHQALVSACDNTWLLGIRASLYAQSERYRWFSLQSGQPRKLGDEHASLADAVLSRDAARARKEIAAHINSTTEIVMLQGLTI
jgi:DNA-binding GntR family transcriptional regulator